MSELSRALLLKALLVLLFTATSFQLHAQAWLPGYNYRKKITVNKAMVAGTVDLQNFQLLVALEDPDLRYVASACQVNKISGSKGRDFAFTLASAPQTPLHFQLDDYVADIGKLVSWIRIPVLAAAGSRTAATEIYLYYGSNAIHFPESPAAQLSWNNDQDRIWHMNAQQAGSSIGNAASYVSEERLQPGIHMDASNYVPGKFGSAIHLNGTNQYLTSGKFNSTNFFISCWIKFTATDREQVIVSSDSAGVGGFVLKINAQGRMVQETRTNNTITSRTANLVMVPNRWYHLVSQSFQGKREFFINGENHVAGLGNVGLKAGGAVFVGASKLQDGYFGGIIDELRIQIINPGADWIKTSYVNQLAPAGFYQVSVEESSGEIVPTGMVFSNVLNDLWTEPANWNSGEVPGDFEQVILQQGSNAKLQGLEGLTLNKLSLEAGATLALDQELEVLCEAALLQEAKISIGNGSQLQLDAGLLNHGVLASADDAVSGGLLFSGAALQLLRGNGRISVQQLVMDKASSAAVLELQQAVSVSSYVRATMGVLNANGHLTLKNSGPSKQAFLWPMGNPGDAAVQAEVTVEQYVPGGYPAPATARGWRLQSSPVYHGSAAATAYYHLYDWKAAMFVTGPGGSGNGFDDSPQHGHTIYTHNQAVPGSLSQKYSGIASMNTSVDLGKGIYVFSRGDRLVPDAYARQIQTAAFESPGAYVIRHKGLLFQGALQVQVHSRNMGESGDGFNLLGNPYASDLSWGALEKEGVSSYVWKFNPLNNAYDVSNDPGTIIKAGQGFFVKVLNGQTSGSVAFTEAAKVTNEAGASSGIAARTTMSLAPQKRLRSDAESRISLNISRDVFEQQYRLVLADGANDDVDDQDATAIGTGYVGISGIGPAGIKLAVDTRANPGRRMLELPLFVKGYVAGRYQIRVSGISTLEPGTELILADKYLNTRQVLHADQVYDFEMNPGIAESFGAGRFALIIKPKVSSQQPEADAAVEASEILVYPNPFVSSFRLKLPAAVPFRMELRLRDLMGQLKLRSNFGSVNGMDAIEVDTNGLASGIYLMELVNLDTGSTIKTSKLIKR